MAEREAKPSRPAIKRRAGLVIRTAAGAAVGVLGVVVLFAALQDRYDALGIGALGLWLLTGMP